MGSGQGVQQQQGINRKSDRQVALGSKELVGKLERVRCLKLNTLTSSMRGMRSRAPGDKWEGRL